MKKVMTYRELFKFKWPPRMPSYPFTIRKRYEHKVVVISDSDPEIGFVLDFPNEQKARHFMYAAKQAKNSVIVEYERKEIHKTDEGWIL